MGSAIDDTDETVCLTGFEFRTHHDVNQTRVMFREIREDVIRDSPAERDAVETIIFEDAVSDVGIAGAFLRHDHLPFAY